MLTSPPTLSKIQAKFRRNKRGLLALLPILMLSLVIPAHGQTSQGQPQRPDPTLLAPPKVTTGSDQAMARVDPQVLLDAKQAADGATIGIIIVTQGPLALADAASLQSVVRERPDANGLTFTSARLAPSALAKTASASNIIAVLSNTPPQIPSLPEPKYARPQGPRPYPGNGSQQPTQSITQNHALERSEGSKLKTQNSNSSPDSWHTVDVHHVRDAWEDGYRGDGVKVALLDSGVDFGHPDLQNTFARVDNPASPYYGWPYVVDPYSMELMSLGVLHDVPEAIKGYGSWFVDTSTTVQGARAQFTTVTATPGGMERVTHTYTLPGASLSGVYHIGIHPDEHLAFDIYHEYPAVLVVDTVTPGVYDTVYVDLNDNYDFRDDQPLSKGNEIATRDTNGDGVADQSSGLLYFIGDGHTPIPASDWLFGLLAPGNGDMVALFGSMDYNEDHGTFCASSVVAQGQIDGDTPLRPPYKPEGVGGMVQGMAPNAKLVAIGNIYRSNLAVYNSMLIATLGLDGWPNTGDEPQVASMSFGYSGGWNNGWDYMSRYLMYLSQYNPQLAYMAANGNGGPGYGTVTPPATSPAVIAVGAATQYGETTTFEPIPGVDRITWGDVQPWSNRGPSHLGQPKPDIVAVGAWGTGDVPLNMAPHNGDIAYDVWGGTSMSTPVGAGIAALVYQAYKARTGSWPTAETVRSILKSSATDLNYDPFAQGAGMLNAARAVQLANGTSGVMVSPSSWVPGTTAPGFMGVMLPGDTIIGAFNIQNPSASSVTASISAEQLVETSEYEWSVPINNDLESSADFSRPDYLWNMTSHIPANTDLLRVTAVISYTDFSASNPRSPFLGASSAWRVLAYDWHDDNQNGMAWHDDNQNGVVNAGEDERGEVNRFTYGYSINDMLELDVEEPLLRSHDGLLIGLQHQIASRTIPASTLHMKMVTYRKQTWPWLSPPSGQITVPPGQTVPVTVAAQVPSNAATGAYEGSLSLVVTGNRSQVEQSQGQSSIFNLQPSTVQRIIVPVAINVRADGLPTTFGGSNNPPSGTPFDNGRVSGAQNWGWRPESGDWRHYYVNNTQQPPNNTFLWAHTDWSNFPTDFDLTIGGPSPWDWFSQHYPSFFGPHGMDGMASSVWTNLGNGAWSWRTNTDTTEEWVSARLGQTGTHEAVLHNVFYSGLAHSELFTATLGTVQLSRDSLDITTTEPQGSATLTMTTNMDLPGVRAQAYGLAQKQTWRDNQIRPLHTWFTETNVSNVASIEFSTEAPEDVNVDLFVDHWENNRYVWLASSGGPDGNEYVRIEPALPGNYRVRVDAARDTPDPSHFDFSIKAIAGTDLSVSPSAITDTIPAGTTLTFTVSFDRPSITDGIWEGKLFLGPYKAPALQSLPVTVYYGSISPTPTPTPRPCRLHFTDVPASHWAHDYIQTLFCQGVVSGYLDQTFRPDDLSSRVQLTKMVVLAMGWPLQHPVTPTFTDVPELGWGYEYVETAVSHGIIGGYSDGTFRPYNPVTRGQLSKILVLAKGWPLKDPAQPTFSDVPPDSAFYSYVETGVQHGLITGYADGTYHPATSATRAQLSKLLSMAMNAP